jgi:hypothetical protein
MVRPNGWRSPVTMDLKKITTPILLHLLSSDLTFPLLFKLSSCSY